jgi:hypothetical protein
LITKDHKLGDVERTRALNNTNAVGIHKAKKGHEREDSDGAHYVL